MVNELSPGKDSDLPQTRRAVPVGTVPSETDVNRAPSPGLSWLYLKVIPFSWIRSHFLPGFNYFVADNLPMRDICPNDKERKDRETGKTYTTPGS